MNWKREVVLRATRDFEGRTSEERICTFEAEEEDVTIVGRHKHLNDCAFTIVVKLIYFNDEELMNAIMEGVAKTVEEVFARRDEKPAPLLPPEDLEFKKKLDEVVEWIGFPVRVSNALEGKIHFVGELIQLSESDIIKTPGLGRKSLKDIKDALASQGLVLGMKFPFDWKPPTKSSTTP